MKRYLLLSFLTLFSGFLLAKKHDFTFVEFEKLEALPSEFWELSSSDRIELLRKNIKAESEPLLKYRLLRTLIVELYTVSRRVEAAARCNSINPLEDDFFIRGYCIEVSYTDFNEFKVKMFGLINEVKLTDDNDMVAELYSRLAWRQSQKGDIAGSFSNYENALQAASPDNLSLINSIMFDTASNYIVHGNDYYVEKGVELLANIRKSIYQELLTEVDLERRAILMWDVQLAYFNTGIAYVLHLHDYEKAIQAFDSVSGLDNPLGVNAVSYSAFAAAKLGKLELSKMYLQQVQGLKDGDPIVDIYLECYRQLAEQYWNADITLTACLSLHKDTTIEVKLDLYKRLSENPNPGVALFGLRSLKDLFVNILEPQLRNSGSQAASNAEVTRLEKESELKSLILKQQKQLQDEIDTNHANEQKFFIVMFLFLFFFIFIVVLQLRQKKKLAQQFQEMSVRDALTKLGNRRFLEQQIDREFAFVKRAIKSGKSATLGIFIFDVDHFKKVNDTHGHSAGDEVLQKIGDRVSHAIRDTDLFVRWGGEEFVFVARLDNAERKYELADRILDTINSEPFKVLDDKLVLDVTCTIGVIEFPFMDTQNTGIWNRLISVADVALYYGKSLGRNCWVVINNEGVNQEEQVDHLVNNPIQDSVDKKFISVRTSFDKSADR